MNIENLIEALNDQWWFAETCEKDEGRSATNKAMSVYMGMIRAIEALGYDWQRDFEGHHKVFGGAK